MDDLPYALEAEVSITKKEIEMLKDQYHLHGGEKKDPQTKFDYAWALVRSPDRKDQQLGVQLLNELYKEQPSRRRECLYYLALGEYKLGNYR
ncbi:mitochondrial membrane protein, partial [Quaeritorhiza haematococci]